MIKRAVLLPLAIALALAAGCSPSSQQRTEMVQCQNGLKVALLDIEISLSDPSPSTNSIEQAIARMKTCPVIGVNYLANPDLHKWIARTNYGSEIAIFCPDPHYKTIKQTRYAAIQFDGTLLKLTNAPTWSAHYSK